MKREALTIVGNGMAAARLIQELITRAPERYSITTIGDEPGPAYNRILLSAVLSGHADAQELSLRPAAWWDASGVEVISGVSASSVDLVRRRVTLGNGRSISYGKLVFATGSNPLRLPIQGAKLPGVHVFRTIEDADRLAQLGRDGARVAVIGGGLLGIEAAYGLARRGGRITLVHLMDRLMERQLDAYAASLVRSALETRGIAVLLEAQTSAVLGSTHVEGLQLSDGRILDADAVVMAAGIRPNADLARVAGLAVNRGIVVNAQLETGAEGVFAIGECAEVEGQCCGLVEPAYAQADALARRLSGEDEFRYGQQFAATNLKVSGLPVFSAGNFLGGNGSSSIVLRDPGLGLYKKFVTRDGKLEGAVLVGDTSEAAWYLNLIRERISISSFRSGLAFGEAYCGGDAGAVERRAA